MFCVFGFVTSSIGLLSFSTYFHTTACLNREGETFVFYEYMDGLGVANIVKSEKGYGWKRSQPYNDFEVDGELAYSTSSFG